MAAAKKALDERGKSILRRLIDFIRPYRWVFVLATFLTLLMSVFMPLRPAIVQQALDGAVAEGVLSDLRFWVVLLVGLTVVHSVILYFQTWVTNWMAQTVMNDLRLKVFRHLTSLRMKYFDKHAIGQLQTRTISDIETLNDVFSQGLVTIIGQLLQLVAITAIMFWVNWRLALIVLAIMPLVVIATNIFRKRVRESFNRVRRYVSQLNAFTQEHIVGMSITQVFNREQEEARRFRGINQKHRKAHLDTIFYYSIFFPVIELISALALAVLVWFGGASVIAGYVSFGELVAFILYVNMFFRPIRMIAERFNQLQLGIVSGERIFKVLDTDEEIEEVQEPMNPAALDSRQLRIEFRNVNFGYNPNEPILKEVSFSVEPGTTTALVGATGAGKSTVINILMRFYEFQTGQVLLNGNSIRNFRKDDLRKAMGLVLQDVFLFNGSILDNITLNNPDISRKEVQQAAEAIGAHRFIEQLPGGYDFNVGERGVALSTGQRQLISFIRVMVYDPNILLLDEATANIDTETEVLIQQAIDTVLKNRTSIIIAHRLSTIQAANQILVLRKGEIIERGKHQELLEQRGYYWKLTQLQYAPRGVA